MPKRISDKVKAHRAWIKRDWTRKEYHRIHRGTEQENQITRDRLVFYAGYRAAERKAGKKGK